MKSEYVFVCVVLEFSCFIFFRWQVLGVDYFE